jgi:hypothetical protein
VTFENMPITPGLPPVRMGSDRARRMLSTSA